MNATAARKHQESFFFKYKWTKNYIFIEFWKFEKKKTLAVLGIMFVESVLGVVVCASVGIDDDDVVAAGVDGDDVIWKET